MTRAEFERVEEAEGLESALFEVGDERILNYESMQDLVAEAVFHDEYQKAKALIALIENADKGWCWVKHVSGLPTLIGSADDVAFLLD